MKRNRAEPWEESDAEEASEGESDESGSDQENNPATLSRLRAIIRAKDAQIDKLTQQVESLNSKLRQPQSAAPSEREPSAEELAAAAEKWRRSLKSNLLAQMVYKPSVKREGRSEHGGGARLSAEIPNISLAQAQAILGEGLVAKARNGAKQLMVQAEAEEVLGGHLSKGLRYGACLGLSKGLKVVYSKESRTLTASGTYTMHK